MIYYVLICRECEPLLPMPFSTPEERGRWATEHTFGTGHHSWIVWDEPRDGDEEYNPRWTT